jgi:signal transduction histidine kinase/CheY-like chemotaxis protein
MEDPNRDATAEDALQRAHDTFRHLVDHSPFGIYVVDADFRLVQVSAGAQKVFEQVRPLIGRDFAEVLRQLWPEPFASRAIGIFRHTLDTGEPYHAPSTVEKRQDIGVVESYDWKTERLRLPDGRWGVVCHFYDLSERQRFEAELKEADRQKDLFLAMLAHELRNPLAPIRTAAGILLTAEPPKDIVKACAETIERQTAQMTRLLDDLLDVSRLSRGRLLLQRAPVSIAYVLAIAAETSRPAIDAQQQKLTVDAGDERLVVDGDGVRLAQVFANLLHNASKYGDRGGQISVQARREGQEAIVRVTDTGMGMTAELLTRLFELFVQGPADRGGLGIGLSLAKRLVEMHGGTISAHSDGPGQGSEFTVRLPLTSAAVARDHSPEDQPTSTPARKVLIVDDNADVTEITELLLKGAGCDVRVANDGATALDTAEKFQPEIVLMDLGMPELDGFQACRRIRASSWGQSVLMIAVSGWARPEDQQRSAAAGFDRHLVKPVDPRTLITIVGS